jgi:hypothetical protein
MSSNPEAVPVPLELTKFSPRLVESFNAIRTLSNFPSVDRKQ